jgi:hypothetical protein
VTPATVVNLIGQEQGEKTVKIGEKIRNSPLLWFPGDGSRAAAKP